MKKILFNDKFGLTKAVIDGRKTQTRRVITYPKTFHGKDVCGYYVCRRATDRAITEVCMYDENERFIDEGQILPKYKVGEVVAVAQSYCSIAEELENSNNATCAAHYEKNVQKASEYIAWMEHPGFNNKMFVAADMMPHQIHITNIRIEKLQDISDEDCLREGLEWDGKASKYYAGYTKETGKKNWFGNTPREAFAHLINKVSRKDIWEANPYVFVYDFELVNDGIMKNKLVAFITSTSFLDVELDLSGYEYEHGTHNGYVAVPPGNKYHGKIFDDMEDFEVHGGITFSEPATYPDVMNGMEIRKEYVGKRNKLLEKAEFITDNTEIGDDWWIFGFDTAHWGDNKYNWDRQAVIEETLSMMEQLNRE